MKTNKEHSLLLVAIASYFVMYFYTSQVFFIQSSISYLIFALIYIFTLFYLAKAYKLPKPTNASKLAALVFLLQAIAIARFNLHYGPFGAFHYVMYHLTCIYFTLAICNATTDSSSANYLSIDLLQGIFPIPFSNLTKRFTTIKNSRKTEKQNTFKQQIVPIIISILVLLMILSLLSNADTSFNSLLKHITINFKLNLDEEIIFKFLLSLFFGSYVFGLIYGSLNHKQLHTKENIDAFISKHKTVSINVFHTLITILIFVYIAFFYVSLHAFIQTTGSFTNPNLTSHLAMMFAVNGFNELIMILLINFLILFALNMFTTTNKHTRYLVLIFMVCSICFVAFDAYKLYLYATLYGVTPRRIIATWILVFLGIDCLMFIVNIYKPIKVHTYMVVLFVIGFSILANFNFEAYCLKQTFKQDSSHLNVDKNFLRSCKLNESKNIVEYTNKLIDSGFIYDQPPYVIADLYNYYDYEYLIDQDLSIPLDKTHSLHLIIDDDNIIKQATIK